MRASCHWPPRSLLELFRSGRLVYALENFFDINLSCHLAQARAGNIIVAFEAAPVHLREHVTERIIGEAEEEVVFTIHFAFEVESDIGKRFTGDSDDLGIPEIDQVQLHAGSTIFQGRVAQGRQSSDLTHHFGIHWERDIPGPTE